MIKNETKLAVALALVVAFAAASVQALHFNARTDNDGHVYAKELFGAGSEAVQLTYPADENGGAIAPRVSLQPVVPPTVGGTSRSALGVQRGLVTFTLHGAVFGDAVALSDLVAVAGEPSSPTSEGRFTKRLVAGGAEGDNYVRFEVSLDYSDLSWVVAVEARPACPIPPQVVDDCNSFGLPEEAFAGIPGNYPQDDFGLVFTLPVLKGVNAALSGTTGVRMSILSDGITSAWPPFNSATARQDGEGPAPVGHPVAETGYFPVVIPPAEQAVTFTVADGDTMPAISLESRLMFVRGGAASADFTSARSISVEPVSQATGPIWGADGKAFSTAAGSSGAGVVSVVVTGNIRDTDAVFLNRNPAAGVAPVIDAGEALTVGEGPDGNLMAYGSFALPVSGDVVVRTDGESLLRPGLVTTAVSVDYSAATAADPAAMSKESRLAYQYAGADNPSAYAIAPQAAADNSNVRVKCEDNSPCQIYFACDSTDGADVFGKVDGTIPARSTMVFRSETSGEDDTAMQLDEVVDGWDSGRLSCQVISGQTVAVQVLTRSGGVLVNNTYVDDGG